MQPRLEAAVAETLRAAVVATLAAAPFVNDQVDRTRASILYRYAAHMRLLHKDFDAGRHLLEDHLIDYWANACGDLTPRSRDKALSVLRTIATGRAFADGMVMRRPPTSAPYSDSDWRVLRLAADRLVDPRWAAEARMLLDLSGEVGLRGAEINRARGSALRRSGRWILTTADGSGTNGPRVVPVGGAVAERLAPFVGSREHLLRPQYQNRKNAVSSLVTRLAIRDHVFTDFRAAAARHRWLAMLLTQPIAYVDLVYLAGLERDSHTLHDIRAHLPAVTPTNAANALLGAPQAHGDADPRADGSSDALPHDDGLGMDR